jgi:hypothetical protein
MTQLRFSFSSQTDGLTLSCRILWYRAEFMSSFYWGKSSGTWGSKAFPNHHTASTMLDRRCEVLTVGMQCLVFTRHNGTHVVQKVDSKFAKKSTWMIIKTHGRVFYGHVCQRYNHFLLILALPTPPFGRGAWSTLSNAPKSIWGKWVPSLVGHFFVILINFNPFNDSHKALLDQNTQHSLCLSTCFYGAVFVVVGYLKYMF